MAQAQFDRHLRPGDARAALDRIAGSQAFQSSRFSSSVYEDEPILRTGSQFRRDKEGSRAYQLIHQLAQRDDLKYAPAAKVFYEQAKALADFDGHGGDPATPFKSYYPTYQAMNDRQLMGYLAWRAQARKGVIAASTASYAFVYIYELLMGVGVEEGMPALAALTSFWVAWKKGATDDAGLLDFYLHTWLRDYIVYHDLDRSLLAKVSGPVSQQDVADVYAAVPILREAEALVLAAGPEALAGDMAQKTFNAICQASSFRLTGSRFYKEHPAETVAVTCGVFARMVQHCSKRRKVGYVEGLFGAEQRRAHPMFYGAVFYAPQPHPDATYRVNDHEAYICRNGSWRRKLPCAEETRSRDLALVLHTIDHEMRRIWEFPKQVRAYEVPRYVEGFVVKEAEAAHEAWLAAQAPKAPKVKIDRSLLRGIRTAAVKTRESLLVDEEREETPVWGAGSAGTGVGIPAGAPAAQDAVVAAAADEPEVSAFGASAGAANQAPVSIDASKPEMASSTERPESSHGASLPRSDGSPASVPCGLTPSELAFLRALLAGDLAAARRAAGPVMLNLAVDSVNEKLYDEIGDAVIEFDGDTPQLVEDYRDDVAALLA